MDKEEYVKAHKETLEDIPKQTKSVRHAYTKTKVINPEHKEEIENYSKFLDNIFTPKDPVIQEDRKAIRQRIKDLKKELNPANAKAIRELRKVLRELK